MTQPTKWSLGVCFAGLLIVLTILVFLPENRHEGLRPSENQIVTVYQAKQIRTSPLSSESAQTPKQQVSSGSIGPSGNDVDDSEVLAAEESRSRLLFEKALASTSDRDGLQRADAARRLAAFPNNRSEAELTRLLAGDEDCRVREQAVRSFSAFENPSNQMWTSLFSALRDPSSSVQCTAVDVLRLFMSRLDPAERASLIKKEEIRTLLLLPNLTPQTREALQAMQDG